MASQSVETQEIVVEGPYAEEAKALIDIEYLLETTCNQMGWWPKVVEVAKLRKLAQKLGPINDEIGEVGDRLVEDRDMLLKLPQFFLITQHEGRCPCAHGVSLAHFTDRSEFCDAVPALEQKEKQLKEIELQKFVLELKRQATIRKWQANQTFSRELEEKWDASIMAHFYMSFLRRLKQSADDEIETRYSIFSL